MKMKIDIEQLRKIEKEYCEEISLYSLKQMVGNVLGYNESSYKLAPNNVKVSIETLKELKILVGDIEKPEAQQLNS